MEELFRIAVMEDLPFVSELFNKAVLGIIKEGIFQWDERYPTQEILKKDILNGEMYVLTKGKAVLSAVVLNESQDDQYTAGDWKYRQEKTAVIHRLCVNREYQHRGVGRETILSAEEVLKEKGYTSVRLDAFLENPYALRLYEKLGYSRRGEVMFRKGKFYLYEKKL